MNRSKSARHSNRPPALATIQDVARAAGVSAKTVSRVVNQEAHVAEKTEARVQKVIRDMAYHPHVGAQTLRAQRRDCIGLTFPAPLSVVPISEQLLSYMFSHFYRLFGSKGTVVSFDFGLGVGDSGTDYARGLWTRRYGGLFILGPLATGDPIIRRVHASGYPYLATSRVDSLPECSSATVDFEEAAYLSTKYFVERGHRQIALLTSFDRYNAGEERHRGHARALAEAGIACDDRLIRGVSFTSHQITTLVHRLLMDPEVTALVDSSVGEDAESIREGARRAGRVVGENVEVLCWTYTDNAAVMSEACAHVWVPIREAAVEGLEGLAEWFDGKRTGPISVLYRPILYETKGLQEISKPKPVFDLFS